jgi:transposase-like protein
MVFEQQGEHPTQWAAIRSIAAKIGCSSEALRHWVRKAEVDAGSRAGRTSDDAQELKALR